VLWFFFGNMPVYGATMTTPQTSAKSQRSAASNVALFGLHSNPSFIQMALAKVCKLSGAILVSDDPHYLASVPPKNYYKFRDVGLDGNLVEAAAVTAALKTKLPLQATALVVDMRWAMANSEAITSLERWGTIAEQLSAARSLPVVSVYDQDFVIEEHLQTALRVHSQFLSPSGLTANPYWLPATLRDTATLDEQLAFMLGRVVPDYQGLFQHRKQGDVLARGATPSWLGKTKIAVGAKPAGARWHIHCFGQLRVVIGGRSIEWRIPGATPKKTRTLFAYLLQSSEKGVQAEQISELLWPDEEQEDVKRARLHHTIAMLRKTLGSADSVLRIGDYYRLNPPPGSWIDIDTFEQLCRRGLALVKKGDDDAALQLYLAAHHLYAGDLFEDVPRDYTESELENWCMPRRIWLHEMALKLQNDMTSALLRTGRSREALEHCMKALSLDPASESANAQAMQIFFAQGRQEAIHRQYRQYKQAVTAVGATESAELRALFQELGQPGA
jgi:DNA-binding SARP family transcriptional activator